MFKFGYYYQNNMVLPYFKVSVLCFTFNQSKYILDALNGFAMQETTFPFVCCIVDDASTDGEQEVINDYLNRNFNMNDESYEQETEYAHVKFARHKTNVNCYFAVLFLKYNHYSIKKDKDCYLEEWTKDTEYEALCEGDDYWIDSHKLQKQVIFLNEHKEYTLCCHNAYREHNKVFSPLLLCFSNHVFHPLQVFLNWNYPTASFLYRRNLINQQYYHYIEGAPVGDGPLLMFAVMNGKIKYFKQKMNVYRYLTDGSWSLRIKEDLNKADMVHSQLINWYERVSQSVSIQWKKYFNYLVLTEKERGLPSNQHNKLTLIKKIKIARNLKFSIKEIMIVILTSIQNTFQ